MSLPHFILISFLAAPGAAGDAGRRLLTSSANELGPVIRWDTYVIQDWGKGNCSIGRRIDDHITCQDALNAYTRSCGGRVGNGIESYAYDGLPGCQLEARVIDGRGRVSVESVLLQYNSNLNGTLTQGHAPLCQTAEAQPLTCLHRPARWESYVLGELGARDCSEGTRIDDYDDCLASLKAYAAACPHDSYEDLRLSPEPSSGTPGCHIRDHGFARFRFNTNLNGGAYESHAPVCRIATSSPDVQCFRSTTESWADEDNEALDRGIYVLWLLVSSLIGAVIILCGTLCSVGICWYCKCCCFGRREIVITSHHHHHHQHGVGDCNSVVVGRAVGVPAEARQA
eukprot:TRINITY_DN121011_c0_g1_i1.p1 TRINITY_DN121011_c0_g1~~TRINITY_DN121011_c0_g1_i1.p1  ORF type:complete len:341 (+),score=18.24 TRINITY_DN121011_c0_g1_i1:76-1098(+)